MIQENRRVIPIENEAAVAGKTEVIEKLEQEFAFLARVLEANNRRRAYPLDRAPYLLLVRLAEGAQSISALAAALLLDDSTVTRQVAAMQKRGLVRKLVNPADRRSALVERTAKGAVEVGQMKAERLARIASLFEGWQAEDTANLAEMLGRVNALLADNQAAGK